MEQIRRNTKPVLPAAGLVAVAVALLLAACSEAPPDTEVSTTTIGSVTSTTTDGAVHPDVPQIECDPLITFDEIDVAFNMVGEFPDVITFERGEACTHTLAEDEEFYIRIEPGHPDDFETGARINGVTGEPVDGVGEEALWFGTEGQAVSTISVRAVSTFGALHYRVVVSRPDADAASHREATRTLALAALPRFPGVEPEPVVFEFATGPADLSGLGYVENILAKEADGEWTRGEGLVATLRYLAGETGPSGVVRQTELVDFTATPLLALAREYLVTGQDASAKGEIDRLLDGLFPTAESLQAMVEEPPAAAGLLVSLYNFLAQQDDVYCQQHYGIPGKCLVPEIPPALEARWPGQYRVYRPVASVAGGWTLARIDNMAAALSDSVLKYSELVEMPPISVYLLGAQGKMTHGGDYSPTGCVIRVYAEMQTSSPADSKQQLARAVADCLIVHVYGVVTAWWSAGLSIYLSGYVYQETNAEHKNLPAQLKAMELHYNLESRAAANWVFFEYLHELIGVTGNLDLFIDLERGLGTIRSNWHRFNERLTDTTIADLGGGDVPYDPPFEDAQISGPMVMPPKPDPVGVARAQMTVPSGKIACVTYETTGQVKVSWRSGVPGTTGGSWSTDLPDELTDISVFLVTTTDAGQLVMTVEKVVDEEKGCEKEDVIDLDDPSDCLTLQCGPSSYYFEED